MPSSSAGAGGKGETERTRAVDYEGAVKVFDVVECAGAEATRYSRERGRHPESRHDRDVPSALQRSDKESSRRARHALKTYYKW